MTRLTGLDALRAVAALMVLILHLNLLYDHSGGAFTRSYLAVDFFFMLSGFVMARTYEANGQFVRPAANFLAMRFRRLWPPMVVAAALAAGFLYLRGVELAAIAVIILPLAVMLPNPLTSLAGWREFPVNGPAWSVFAELVGNALHGAILWRLRTVHLVALAGSVLIVMQALDPGLDGTGNWALTKGIARVVAAYSIGVALSRLRLPQDWPLWPALFGLPGMIIGLAVFDASPLWDVAFLAACPLFIICGLAPRVSSLSAMAGALSFPLYAVHLPTIQIVLHFSGGIVVAAAASLIAALLVALFIDRRLWRYLRKQASST